MATDPNLMLQSLTQAQQALTQQALQRKVLQDTGAILGTGLGLGIGARGLWGLAQQIGRNVRKPRPTVPSPLEVEIPVEEMPEEKLAGEWLGDQVARRAAHVVGGGLARLPIKASPADHTGTIFTGGKSDTSLNHPGRLLGPYPQGREDVTAGRRTFSQIRNNLQYSQPSSPGFAPSLPPAAIKPKAPPAPSKEMTAKRAAGELPAAAPMGSLLGSAANYLGGSQATQASGVPLAYPLWAAAGLGGVAGGWTLADWLLDKRRRRSMQQELGSAKQEYNDALYGKTAEALGSAFEKLAGGILSGLGPPEHRGTINGALAGATAGIPAAIGIEGVTNEIAKPFGNLATGVMHNHPLSGGAMGKAQFAAHDILGDAKLDLNKILGYARGNPGARTTIPAAGSLLAREFTPPGTLSRTARLMSRLTKFKQLAPLWAILGLTTVGGAIGSLFNKKQAGAWEDTKDWFGNASGQTLGAYGVYAGLGGLASGMLAYNAAKKRQRRTLLEAAQKERQRQRYEAMPTPIYATPVPVIREEEPQDSGFEQAAPSLA